MKTALYIIVDVSGSMSEMGKIHLQKNLCRYAAQLQLIDPKKYSGIDIHFYQWAQCVSKITVQSDGDIPPLNASGSSRLNVLSNFISSKLNGTDILRVLILSDGNFSSADIIGFQEQINSFQNLIMNTISIGADADLLKLKKISSNKIVYFSENISAAIDCTIFGTNTRLKAPESMSQITYIKPEKSERDWDD